MKTNNEPIDRLMRAAAQARPAEISPASFTLEARVLGQWRAMRSSDAGECLVVWFRRAAVGACVLALASMAWSRHIEARDGGLMAVADSAMGMGAE